MRVDPDVHTRRAAIRAGTRDLRRVGAVEQDLGELTDDVEHQRVRTHDREQQREPPPPVPSDVTEPERAANTASEKAAVTRMKLGLQSFLLSGTSALRTAPTAARTPALASSRIGVIADSRRAADPVTDQISDQHGHDAREGGDQALGVVHATRVQVRAAEQPLVDGAGGGIHRSMAERQQDPGVTDEHRDQRRDDRPLGQADDRSREGVVDGDPLEDPAVAKRTRCRGPR